jgi:DNA-binding transcriptional regulator YdaS (Cro superfamily)
MKTFGIKVSPIKMVTLLIGGQSELARKLNITPQCVNKWVGKNQVPVKYVLEIEKLTKKEITRYHLRPDIFGDKPDK